MLFYYFCLVIECSGSVSLTNGSGSATLLEMLPADLSPPGVAAVHDVVRHQEEGLQELHCPAQDVGQPVQYTITMIRYGTF